jgi:hypothetical protein
MTGLYDVLDFFAYALRFLGAVVFGVGAGWLVVHLIKGQAASWQLSAAALLGLLAAFVLIGHWVSGAATLGGFGLGAGGGLLVWGLGTGSGSVTPERPAGRAAPRRPSAR